MVKCTTWMRMKQVTLHLDIWWNSGVSDCFIMVCCNLTDKDDDTSEDEEEQELDKKMGDLGEGHMDTLDEKMWGDDEDNDEEEEECEKEEESGRGIDQVQTMR